jgi:thiol-disulfide isomerase/thioredoxin
MKRYLLLSLILLLFCGIQSKAQNQLQKVEQGNEHIVMLAQDATWLGYNIYRNGTKINPEILTELQYQDSVPENGSFTYYVTAVYEDGESGSSNSVEVIIDQDAVNREYVVFEEGTGTWCIYCPAAANGYEDLVEAGKNVVGIAYHSGDAYANTEAIARIDYYGMPAFPSAFFDGIEEVVGGGYYNQSMYGYYLPIVEEREAIPTAFAMTSSGKFDGTSYTASVRIEQKTTNNSADLRLVGVLTENHIDEEWQGMTELNEVARDVMPSASGELISFDTDSAINVDLSFVMEKGWVKENCKFIAFVQDYDTKEIFQAIEMSMDEFTETKLALKTTNLETFLVPANLEADYSMMSPRVDLSWETPSANPRWMHWDDSVTYSYGNGSLALTFDIAARWDTNDLKPLDGMMITKVAFYLLEPTCEYSVRIWSGEDAKNMIVNDLLETFEVGQWSEIALDDTVLLDINKELWVGCLNNNSQGAYSATMDGGPAVEGKGAKIRIYLNNIAGDWKDFSFYDQGYNWNIRFYVEPYVEPQDTTSILEKVKPELTVYPNPAKSNINIVSDTNIDQLYLISVNGQVLCNKKVNAEQTTLSLEGVKSGIYFVKISTENGFGFKKLVVE